MSTNGRENDEGTSRPPFSSKKNLQEELMERVKEKTKMRQIKKIVEEELLMETKRKEEIRRRLKMLQTELMSRAIIVRELSKKIRTLFQGSYS